MLDNIVMLRVGGHFCSLAILSNRYKECWRPKHQKLQPEGVLFPLLYPEYQALIPTWFVEFTFYFSKILSYYDEKSETKNSHDFLIITVEPPCVTTSCMRLIYVQNTKLFPVKALL